MNSLSLYYESHVTIEPVFDARLQQLREVCTRYRFRVADLLMKKRPEDTAARSAFDTFCTGRSNDLADLTGRMIDLVKNLHEDGFHVWRYKVEAAILDSKVDDKLLPLTTRR